MPALTNERHEHVAQLLAKGELQKDAYAKAGYHGNEGKASRTCNRPDVRARVAELLERAAARTEVTIADIAKQLDEDRSFAKTVNQAGACVAATMGKAKVLGLIIEKTKTEITNPDGSLRPTVIRIVAADDRSGTATPS